MALTGYPAEDANEPCGEAVAGARIASKRGRKTARMGQGLMSFSRAQGGGRSVEGGERPCVGWDPAEC